MFGKITGVGAFVPEKCLTNKDLESFMETNDDWIRERTGIESRHVISTERTSDMAVKAAGEALIDSGIDPSGIGLVIASSTSADIIVPGLACRVQEALGLKNAACFDLNAACTGFIAAYNTAQVYMNAGFCQNALVVAAESLSKIADWTDRGTSILFGDGAGAVVITADEGAAFETVMHTDGSLGSALALDSPFASRPRAFDENGGQPASAGEYVRMDGQAVFQFAVRQVPACIRELLAKLDMGQDEIDHFLLHQANGRILEAIGRRLKLSGDKIPVNIARIGNTSSASIPLLLTEMVKTGRIRRGDRIIISGFGGGLTWGATYLNY